MKIMCFKKMIVFFYLNTFASSQKYIIYVLAIVQKIEVILFFRIIDRVEI